MKERSLHPARRSQMFTIISAAVFGSVIFFGVFGTVKGPKVEGVPDKT